MKGAIRWLLEVTICKYLELGISQQETKSSLTKAIAFISKANATYAKAFATSSRSLNLTELLTVVF